MNIKYLLFLASALLSSCAADSSLSKALDSTVNTVKEAVDETFNPAAASSSGSVSGRAANVLPAELKEILAPEKKSASNYPRIALALTNIDRELWRRPGGGVYPNACMTVTATVWDNAKSSRPIVFQWCSPDNIVYNVPFAELDYYWFGYKNGAMAKNAPRRNGSRLGPETPKTFWPGDPDDIAFLGVDYNGGTSVSDSLVANGVGALIYYFDLDWEKTDDQRIWVSSIEKIGKPIYEAAPVYKLK